MMKTEEYVECKALAITAKDFRTWLEDPERTAIIKDLPLAGVTPSHDLVYLIFRTDEDRLEGYNMIHRVFPNMTTIFVRETALIKKKYLLKA